tara:strand:- start:91 stop:915 length:825 start_codon:yes stop_codon:yes gene_type:complete
MNDDTSLPAVADEKTDMTLSARIDPMSPAAIWTSFQEMAKDPTMDAAKMQTMYELQKTMIQDQRQEEFNQAKFAAMADMPTIIKNKVVSGKTGNLMYRYSDFKHLYLTVKPILSANRLILDFDVDETKIETKIPFLRVAPVLRHQNGYVWHGSYMPVPITAANSSISLTQAAKGAVETGKRTVTISCLGITEEEDNSITGKENSNSGKPQGENYDWLIEAGQRAAAAGPKEYGKWISGRLITNTQKGWLITHGHHDILTQAARDIAAQQQGQDT